MKKSKFTLKVILLSVLPVLIFLIFSITAITNEIDHLRQTTRQITEQEVGKLYGRLLEDKSRDISQKARLKIDLVLNELNLLRASAQQLVDDDQWQSLGQALQQHDFLANRIVSQSDQKHSNLQRWPIDINTGIWSYLHNPDGLVAQQTQDYINSLTPLKFILPIVAKHGADKQWLYLVGPENTPVLTISPWSDVPVLTETFYPGSSDKNWWNYFFPGILDSWQQWTKAPDFIRTPPREQVTLTPLYKDAGGTGLLMTFFAPVWNRDRSSHYGAAALDYSLNNILDIVNEEHIGESGFAVLLQSDGRLLGPSTKTLQRLGLSNSLGLSKQQAIKHTENATDLERDSSESVNSEKESSKNENKGVEIPVYHLGDSQFAELAQLAAGMNKQDGFILQTFQDAAGERYLISMQNMLDYNLWSPDSQSIVSDSLYVAIIVPRKEAFSSQQHIQNEMNQASEKSQIFLILLTLGVSLISILLAGWFALKHTRQIRLISQGIRQVKERRFEAEVDIVADDELAELGLAFNQMLREVNHSYSKLEHHAQTLEDKVKERTKHLEEANQKLQQLSQLDGLTQIHNRRFFDTRLDEMWREYSRLQQPISLIMIDIDHFKQFNDLYGHQMGDQCLCRVATTLREQLKRSADLIARYGGEEFAAVIATDSDGALSLAEQMRQQIQALAIEHSESESGVVTISLVIATVTPYQTEQQTEKMSELLAMADKALYQSKEAGRNRVTQSPAADTA